MSACPYCDEEHDVIGEYLGAPVVVCPNLPPGCDAVIDRRAPSTQEPE